MPGATGGGVWPHRNAENRRVVAKYFMEVSLKYGIHKFSMSQNGAAPGADPVDIGVRGLVAGGRQRPDVYGILDGREQILLAAQLIGHWRTIHSTACVHMP